MEEEEIKTKVLQTLAAFSGLQPHEIDFFESVCFLITDELSQVEWVIELEKVFGIKLTDDEAEYFVKSSVLLVVRKLKWMLS